MRKVEKTEDKFKSIKKRKKERKSLGKFLHLTH